MFFGNKAEIKHSPIAENSICHQKTTPEKLIVKLHSIDRMEMMGGKNGTFGKKREQQK